ncbi:MAG TPA: T9SS type A sorting domain-containing protein [Bacteroidetes bacterium]|nr:T9SS type A sorting domain-containing protein [Bacteroidota bacterium]
MYTDRYFVDGRDCISSEVNERMAKVKNTIEKLSIFPNPAMGFVNIVVDLSNEKTGNIQIRDIKGKILYKTEVSYQRKNIKLDISEYRSGVYFVKYRSETGEQELKKLLITK